jgi:hypothetical protein
MPYSQTTPGSTSSDPPVPVVKDLLTSIDESQKAENDLITQLAVLTKDGYTGSDASITSITNAINSLSNSRVTMFDAISKASEVLSDGVTNSRSELIQQLTLAGVVEDQLNQSKKTLTDLQNNNDTQLRLVEINTYYGKRYAEQSKLMKLIILLCVPLLILIILKKKGILPELISNYAIGITIAVGGFFIMQATWDIMTRSNMDFDSYDWGYESPGAQAPSKWQYNKEHMFNFDNPLKTLFANLGLCLGSNCCANGMYFDKAKQQCTTTASSNTTIVSGQTESFVCGNTLNGTAVAKFDEDEEKQNGISPYSASSDYAWIR